MNGRAAPPTPSTRTPSTRDLEPDMDAGCGRRDGKQRDHECHGDRVTNHLDGEGLGWRPGDGEIGDDHLRQAWDLGDIDLECSGGQTSGRCLLSRSCLTKLSRDRSLRVPLRLSSAACRVSGAGKSPRKTSSKPAADADAGQDDQDHDGCSRSEEPGHLAGVETAGSSFQSPRRRARRSRPGRSGRSWSKMG